MILFIFISFLFLRLYIFNFVVWAQHEQLYHAVKIKLNLYILYKWLFSAGVQENNLYLKNIYFLLPIVEVRMLHFAFGKLSKYNSYYYQLLS